MSKKNRYRDEIVNEVENIDDVVAVDTTETVEEEKVEKRAIEKVAEELFGEMRDATPEEEKSVNDHIESISKEVKVEEVEDVVNRNTLKEEKVEKTTEVVKDDVKKTDDGDYVIEIKVINKKKGKIVKDRIESIVRKIKVEDNKVVVGPYSFDDCKKYARMLIVCKGIRGVIVEK